MSHRNVDTQNISKLFSSTERRLSVTIDAKIKNEMKKERREKMPVLSNVKRKFFVRKNNAISLLCVNDFYCS